MDRTEQQARDARRYRVFRQLLKDNKLRAQALIWESGGSRTKFDQLIDALEDTNAKQAV